MVHAVVPQQPIPASRAAEVLAEKRIDIGALDEELAQPKNRCPSVAGRSVVPTSGARALPSPVPRRNERRGAAEGQAQRNLEASGALSSDHCAPPRSNRTDEWGPSACKSSDSDLEA